MDRQGMRALLQDIRRKYGDEIFLNGGRLCSYITDLSAGDRAEKEIRLIRRCYHLLPGETAMLVQALSGQGNMERITGQVKSLKEEMRQNFFSAEDIEYMADLLVSAFGVSYEEVSDMAPISLLALDGARLSATLVELDDRFEDDLWRDGKVLESLLRDHDQELEAECRLVACVYDGAGDKVKCLVHEIVRKRAFVTEIARLQQALIDACMEPAYIDVFILALLDVFGIVYENPLIRNKAAAGDLGGTGSETGTGMGNISGIGTGNGQGTTGTGTGNGRGTTGAGSGTGNGNTVGGAKKFFIVFLLISGVSLYLMLKPGDSGEENQDMGQETQVVDSSFSEGADSIASSQEEEANEEEEEEVLYIPSVEESIDIEQVASTIYDDSLTDLRNYGRYTARGKNFTFAYPKELYTDVSLDSGLFDNEYRFAGDDGSSLVYHIETPNHKYQAEEWRENVTRVLTEGMSAVNTVAYSDGDKETHFYVTAEEGNMNVVIVSTYYLSGGPGEWMVLKYPKPVDDEDALRKAYYVECLYCMAGFSDSKDQGFKLRSYEDFVEGR